MKLFSVLPFFLGSVALVSVIEKRQECYRDNCLRAVNGTTRGLDRLSNRTSDYVNYMTASILVDQQRLNLTYATVFPPLKPNKRAVISTTVEETTTVTAIPFYATSACAADSRYFSTCSYLGVTSAVMTTAPYFFLKLYVSHNDLERYVFLGDPEHHTLFDKQL
ncbi:hypothetical protein K469DRAFT_754622 [Zopfia rhizophila CBS 207.26]|uniref:Uncharacterized protein n=1 Tax=Zopfia rhizophila CBS 207.26 TaxID=1314779 RepID=A0A6A6DIP6_9PEZI|nr:hypothetical protein K469DRAFT_754622 [Zopfia rhizophila CBS 207.26]